MTLKASKASPEKFSSPPGENPMVEWARRYRNDASLIAREVLAFEPDEFQDAMFAA
jgi:hypothetical protein